MSQTIITLFSHPLFNLLLGLVGGGGISWFISRHYYLRAFEDQKQSQKQLVEELKDYIVGDLRPYTAELTAELRAVLDRLEGKFIEGEGRIVIERDEDGNPHALRIAPTQVIQPEGTPSEEEFGEAMVFVGPPPTPPPSVVELEGAVQGQGTMRGDLTVGRRSWWRRFFGVE